MNACEMLTELMNSLSRLRPERFYVSYDDGEIGIMLTTFMGNLNVVKRTACGEEEDCVKLEQFFNFLWALKWRGGCIKIYLVGNPPVHVLEKEYGRKLKVSYLSVPPTRPIYAFQVDVVKLAKELYETYQQVCRVRPSVRQLVAEIVGEESVLRRSRRRRFHGNKKRRIVSEERSAEDVDENEEVVQDEVYELIAK